jgi:hypothetical protein
MNLSTTKPEFKDQIISVECGCKQYVQTLKDQNKKYYKSWLLIFRSRKPRAS